METTKDDRTVAELARSLDCFTEADLCALAGVAPSTVEAWRKRHTGPDYALIGSAFLYPRESLKEFLQARVRRMRGRADAKEAL